MYRRFSVSYLLVLLLPGRALADEPACPEPEAHAFDFWLGTWDIDNVQRNPVTPDDPTLYPTGTALLHVDAVAGGCAVVETWTGSLRWGEVRGFSVRSYDPDTGAWTLVLAWPTARHPVSSFSTLHGGFQHGRGTFTADGTAPDGTAFITRFTFSDIASNRYRWDSERSVDGGLTWATSWVMRGTRRPDGAETADPLPQSYAPPERPLCPEPQARALDRWLGRWTGETDGPFRPLAVTVEVRPILEGCALTERWDLGGSEHFVVRAWDAATDQWVAWRLSADDPALKRLAGEPGAGPVFLTDDGDERVRETLTRKGKRWVWNIEDAHGPEPMKSDVTAVLSPAP